MRFALRNLLSAVLDPYRVLILSVLKMLAIAKPLSICADTDFWILFPFWLRLFRFTISRITPHWRDGIQCDTSSIVCIWFRKLMYETHHCRTLRPLWSETWRSYTFRIDENSLRSPREMYKSLPKDSVRGQIIHLHQIEGHTDKLQLLIFAMTLASQSFP